MFKFKNVPNRGWDYVNFSLNSTFLPYHRLTCYFVDNCWDRRLRTFVKISSEKFTTYSHVQTKGGGVKGFLNNVKKTALFLHGGFPYGTCHRQLVQQWSWKLSEEPREYLNQESHVKPMIHNHQSLSKVVIDLLKVSWKKAGYHHLSKEEDGFDVIVAQSVFSGLLWLGNDRSLG